MRSHSPFQFLTLIIALTFLVPGLAVVTQASSQTNQDYVISTCEFPGNFWFKQVELEHMSGSSDGRLHVTLVQTGHTQTFNVSVSHFLNSDNVAMKKAAVSEQEGIPMVLEVIKEGQGKGYFYEAGYRADAFEANCKTAPVK